VLGKRSHHSQHEPTPPPTIIKSLSRDAHDDDDDDDEASTVDLSPCAKRPRTSLIPTDRKGNKENIPPLRVDVLGESSRALRRSNTESITPTRSRTSMHLPLLFIHTL
jgi:cell division control protein 6